MFFFLLLLSRFDRAKYKVLSSLTHQAYDSQPVNDLGKSHGKEAIAMVCWILHVAVTQGWPVGAILDYYVIMVMDE